MTSHRQTLKEVSWLVPNHDDICNLRSDRSVSHPIIFSEGLVAGQPIISLTRITHPHRAQNCSRQDNCWYLVDSGFARLSRWFSTATVHRRLSGHLMLKPSVGSITGLYKISSSTPKVGYSRSYAQQGSISFVGWGLHIHHRQ